MQVSLTSELIEGELPLSKGTYEIKRDAEYFRDGAPRKDNPKGSNVLIFGPEYAKGEIIASNKAVSQRHLQINVL